MISSWFVGVLLVLLSIAFIAILAIGAWIDYTMATTPPPKPVEDIAGEPENKKKKTHIKQSGFFFFFAPLSFSTEPEITVPNRYEALHLQVFPTRLLPLDSILPLFRFTDPRSTVMQLLLNVSSSFPVPFFAVPW